MDIHRWVFYSSVSIIIIITIVSGPLVSGFDFSRNDPGSTSADRLRIAEPAFPNSATIEPGRFGTDQLIIRLKPLQVYIAAVSGRPSLNYKLRVPALRYVRTAIHPLNERDQGKTIQLGFDPDRIEPERVTQTSYQGEVQIVIRDRNGLRKVASQNITLTVRTS